MFKAVDVNELGLPSTAKVFPTQGRQARKEHYSPGTSEPVRKLPEHENGLLETLGMDVAQEASGRHHRVLRKRIPPK